LFTYVPRRLLSETAPREQSIFTSLHRQHELHFTPSNNDQHINQKANVNSVHEMTGSDRIWCVVTAEGQLEGHIYIQTRGKL